MFKHTHMFMVTKTITVTEDAYKKLANHKHEGESFSELINRSFASKGNVGDIMKFAGAWRDMDNEEVERIKQRIENLNKGSMKKVAQKVRRL